MTYNTDAGDAGTSESPCASALALLARTAEPPYRSRRKLLAALAEHRKILHALLAERGWE